MTEKEKSMKEQLDEDKAQEALEAQAENEAKRSIRKTKNAGIIVHNIFRL